jgi:hypothetical protein
MFPLEKLRLKEKIQKNEKQYLPPTEKKISKVKPYIMIYSIVKSNRLCVRQYTKHSETQTFYNVLWK